ncbi:aminotransferase class I/II-fold pyridoxal phosphate-dependent enzyme [Streptomyces peucetius]|uniref:Aminotransferase class I/II-fold pyridoxal phosphate-dependent enzyme n=2 Tax=Streptomyces peucetius TaxID=1950 RepID=A0ABY6IKW1_STRPE|nr:aminotransferase class I/II-fold pyridoxal phosphate-dependent enzyme [Streptomyces peucetius]UYQ66340.1 aminotransferase class I/II-fold pyridoxal phosphate-dependent enzyme [Streptomyces peucetius]
MWAAMGLAGVVAILVGIRINRPARRWPWLALAAANLAFTAGDTAYNILNSFFDQNNPFPSVADAFYLSTYPLFAAGLIGFIHYRWPGRDFPSLLDALILTSGLAVLLWVYLIGPLSHVEGMTWIQRAISIAYPLGDVLMLTMLTRLLASGVGITRSMQLLTLGTLGILVSDVLYGLLQLKGTWQVGTPMDLGWVVFFTAWGLAALHPTMRDLTEHVPQRGSPTFPAKQRLVLLAAASLVAPGILLYQALHGKVSDAGVIAVFSTALFLLVILRLAGAVGVHRQAVARERALRMAAASLLTAVRPREVANSVETAVNALFGPGVPHRTVLLASEGDKGLYAVHTESTAWDWRISRSDDGGSHLVSALSSHGARLVPLGELDRRVVDGLDNAQCALLCPLALSDRPTGEPLVGALFVAGPERKLMELWSSLEILASQASLAMERVGLSQEVNRRNSEAYFRTLVHNASDVILILDDDNTVRYASPSADGMFGRNNLIGTMFTTLVDPRDQERASRALTEMRVTGDQDMHEDWKVLTPAGRRTDVEARCSNLREDQTVHGLVLTLRDVTEQRQLERELTRRAFHDSLTGLPNRVLLLERIERALMRDRRESTIACVLFIDLDDFKVVNDTMGHTVGDELLTAVAARLTSTLRRSDTAARLGGDEFAVLMEGAKVPLDAEVLASQVIQTLNQSFPLSGGIVSVSASVGIATALDSADGEELLGHADLALYAAKSAGKRQWRRYQPALHADMLERHELQAGLATAVSQEGFALRYQPIVDLGDGHVVGFEALARWPHPRRGLVPPDEFITLAEETGHILPLGAWVLERATADITRWQQATPRPAPLCVNVNVSARQFRDPGFLDEVRRTLETTGLEPGSLVLELTESVLMRRDEQIEGVMRVLKNLGVNIAIDDFGTGFSSLSYLREFPIDVLKVDKSFIDNICVDTQQVALVDGIVRIADTLGLQVIAEGIEELSQRQLLTAMGCRFGQGYLFARPMTADQAEALLSGGLQNRAAGLIDRTGRTTPQQPSGPLPEPRAVDHMIPQAVPTGNRNEKEMRKALPEARGIRHDPRWGDLERLRRTSPMSDAVLDEVDGRRIRCGDHWLTDFASCNYLGFDFDPEIMASIEPQVRKWGTHPSWSRMIGSPQLYPQIEERLTELLGAPDTLVLPTITLIHASVIPALAGEEGHVFVDAEAHRTVYDGCLVARGQGATVRRFHADRPDELREMLRTVPSGSARLVCLDGVNSMTGNLPALGELAEVCRDLGATLYVDDAHGFGIIGERGPDETSPYGSRGNGIVRHLGETYDDVILVSGFSKAYSSLLAFIALPTWLKEHLKVAAAPYLYSGPSPTASLATVLAGFDVNERRGDALRADLHRKTADVLSHVHRLGIDTPNVHGLPIIELPLADASDIDAAALFLWDRGIYVTLAAYPLVPRHRVGFRIQVTALNTGEDIERLNDALTALTERFQFQTRP